MIKMGSLYNKDTIKFKVGCDFVYFLFYVLGSEEGSGQEAAMRTKKDLTHFQPHCSRSWNENRYHLRELWASTSLKVEPGFS